MAIMREKHSALMRPVVFALEHVRSITGAPAETPHEASFQRAYGDSLLAALERLRSPHNPANPASSWLPFKQVGGREREGGGKREREGGGGRERGGGRWSERRFGDSFARDCSKRCAQMCLWRM